MNEVNAESLCKSWYKILKKGTEADIDNLLLAELIGKLSGGENKDVSEIPKSFNNNMTHTEAAVDAELQKCFLQVVS